MTAPPNDRPKQQPPTSQTETLGLVNPYAKWPKELSRLNVDIDKDDYMYLKSISPLYGSTQTFVAIYVKSIINECRRIGITSYSPENHAKLLSIVKRCTTVGPVGNDGGQDVPRGPEKLHQPDTNIAHLAADSTSKAGKGLEGGGKGKTRRQKS